MPRTHSHSQLIRYRDLVCYPNASNYDGSGTHPVLVLDTSKMACQHGAHYIGVSQKPSSSHTDAKECLAAPYPRGHWPSLEYLTSWEWRLLFKNSTSIKHGPLEGPLYHLIICRVPNQFPIRLARVYAFKAHQLVASCSVANPALSLFLWAVSFQEGRLWIEIHLFLFLTNHRHKTHDFLYASRHFLTPTYRTRRTAKAKSLMSWLNRARYQHSIPF